MLSLKPQRFAAAMAIALYLFAAARGATVTMTKTANVVRSQTQGAGTYDVYDFFYSSAAGAEFISYRIIANAASGAFADPAALQDDRQGNSTNETNTGGSVDTYANTVWSFAGKDDLGYNATIIADPGGYVPSGAGAAAPFTFLDWTVSDVFGEDDNDLNDALTNGPVAVTAPYHLVRLLAAPGTTGAVEFHAFDTSQPGTPFIFNFWGEGILTHVVDAEIVVPDPDDPGFVEHTFGYAGEPPVAWDNFEFLSYAPNYGAPADAPGAAAAANATFNADTAAFHWSTTGAPRGDYVWQVRVHDSFGPADTGTLTVRVTVPEPSTAGLFGLVIFGASSAGGRRKLVRAI